MTIENAGVIDFAACDKEAGVVYLAIADHLDWSSANSDHLWLLQEKINAYIPFVESGSIYEGRDQWRGLPLEIRLFALYEPTEEALEFYERTRLFLSPLDIGFRVEQRQDPAFFSH